ncbi:hypothetical protein ACVW0W_002886 [Bradyrhizobium sp. USDA 4469]
MDYVFDEGATHFDPRAVKCRAAYFDKLALRLASSPHSVQLDGIRSNAGFVDIRPGHPIRGSDQHLLLTITRPRPEALKILDEVPHLSINCVEVALDFLLVDHTSTVALRELFDFSFVQPWHGSKQTVQFAGGTYRGPRKPGKNFTWYLDKPDRHGGQHHCLHLEARHQGMSAVRGIGVSKCSDLLAFNFSGYWRANLPLFNIDLKRLGRLHNNRISGQRRRTNKVQPYGRLLYDVDRATGSVLFRNRAAHENQEVRSVQQFVDVYGRGPFLIPIDVSALVPTANETPPHIYCLCRTNDHN